MEPLCPEIMGRGQAHNYRHFVSFSTHLVCHAPKVRLFSQTKIVEGLTTDEMPDFRIAFHWFLAQFKYSRPWKVLGKSFLPGRTNLSESIGTPMGATNSIPPSPNEINASRTSEPTYWNYPRWNYILGSMSMNVIHAHSLSSSPNRRSASASEHCADAPMPFARWHLRYKMGPAMPTGRKRDNSGHPTPPAVKIPRIRPGGRVRALARTPLATTRDFPMWQGVSRSWTTIYVACCRVARPSIPRRWSEPTAPGGQHRRRVAMGTSWTAAACRIARQGPSGSPDSASAGWLRPRRGSDLHQRPGSTWRLEASRSSCERTHHRTDPHSARTVATRVGRKWRHSKRRRPRNGLAVANRHPGREDTAGLVGRKTTHSQNAHAKMSSVYWGLWRFHRPSTEALVSRRFHRRRHRNIETWANEATRAPATRQHAHRPAWLTLVPIPTMATLRRRLRSSRFRKALPTRGRSMRRKADATTTWVTLSVRNVLRRRDQLDVRM